MKPYLDLTLTQFLDEVAAGRPTPGVGSAAAVVVALAAGLLATAGRQSDEARAAEVVARAEELRGLVAPLAQADAENHARVTEASRRPDDDPGRADALREARSGACEVPLAVAGYAAEVAALATRLAQRGNAPSPPGEVIAAAALAETAARVAAILVRLNLSGRQDLRIAQVARLAGQARRDASRLTYAL